MKIKGDMDAITPPLLTEIQISSYILEVIYLNYLPVLYNYQIE